MDKGSTTRRQSFIVFARATIKAEPGEGAFHKPTTGQYGETFLLLPTEDRFKAKTKTLRNPSLQRAALGAVNPDETQFRAETAASSEQLPCPVAVRQVGSADQDGQYESHRIDGKMPFSSCDAFAPIAASHTGRCMAGLGGQRPAAKPRTPPSRPGAETASIRLSPIPRPVVAARHTVIPP